MTVGREITFTSVHSLSSNDGSQRDIGNADVGGTDLATGLLRTGWAKCKENKREPTEEDNKRKALENQAKEGQLGLWNEANLKASLSFKLSLKPTYIGFARFQASTI